MSREQSQEFEDLADLAGRIRESRLHRGAETQQMVRQSSQGSHYSQGSHVSSLFGGMLSHSREHSMGAHERVTLEERMSNLTTTSDNMGGHRSPSRAPPSGEPVVSDQWLEQEHERGQARLEYKRDRRSKEQKLGRADSSKRARAPWTSDEEKFLLEKNKEGKKIPEIARDYWGPGRREVRWPLRTADACANKLRELKKKPPQDQPSEGPSPSPQRSLSPEESPNLADLTKQQKEFYDRVCRDLSSFPRCGACFMVAGPCSKREPRCSRCANKKLICKDVTKTEISRYLQRAAKILNVEIEKVKRKSPQKKQPGKDDGFTTKDDEEILKLNARKEAGEKITFTDMGRRLGMVRNRPGAAISKRLKILKRQQTALEIVQQQQQQQLPPRREEGMHRGHNTHSLGQMGSMRQSHAERAQYVGHSFQSPPRIREHSPGHLTDEQIARGRALMAESPPGQQHPSLGMADDDIARLEAFNQQHPAPQHRGSTPQSSQSAAAHAPPSHSHPPAQQHRPAQQQPASPGKRHRRDSSGSSLEHPRPSKTSRRGKEKRK
ncbi:hypothetical protein F5882DRAFT_379540 [Hyaloscypha sp. PMI_1271]|nr:hypothetical protein F5882DRAFT_379540 [Hyaloscypha sp. PMI_1271]